MCNNVLFTVQKETCKNVFSYQGWLHLIFNSLSIKDMNQNCSSQNGYRAFILNNVFIDWIGENPLLHLWTDPNLDLISGYIIDNAGS